MLQAAEAAPLLIGNFSAGYGLSTGPNSLALMASASERAYVSGLSDPAHQKALPSAKKQKQEDAMDIDCDVCGVRCTAQSFYDPVAQTDFCGVCKPAGVVVEAQVNGITLLS